MSDRPALARVAFLGFRADIAQGISLAVASVLVARGLGPTERGVFFLGFIAATMIAMVGDLGMSVTSLVYGANREIPPRRLHAIAVGFAIAAGLLAALVLLPFQAFWTETLLKGLDTTMLAIVAAGVVAQLYGQVITALLTGMGYVPEVAVVRILQAVVYPVAIALAVLTGEATWALGAWLLTVVGYGLGVGYLALRHAGFPAAPSWSQMRIALWFGMRGYVGTLSFHGFLRLDVFVLGARTGPRDVGIYSQAAIVAERVALFSQAIYSATAERIGKGGEQASALTALSVRMIVTLLVPLAPVLVLLAWPLFPLVFGPDFAEAVAPFAIMLPGTIALSLWSVLALYMASALRRPGLSTAIQVAAFVVSLPLYHFAIGEAGMTGAAAVSSLVYGSVFVAGCVVLLRTSDVGLRDLAPGREELLRVAALIRDLLSRSRRARAAER